MDRQLDRWAKRRGSDEGRRAGEQECRMAGGGGAPPPRPYVRLAMSKTSAEPFTAGSGWLVDVEWQMRIRQGTYRGG